MWRVFFRAHRAREGCSPKGLLLYFSRSVRELAVRGPFSHVREYPPYSVQRHWRCFPRGAARRLKLWEQVNDLREHEKRRLNA